MAEESHETRIGLCEACRDYGTWRVYSPSQFAELVDSGLVPTDVRLRDLAIEARPPKRDRFGNEVIVISTDDATIEALNRSVTSTEKRAALRRWKETPASRSRDALVCESCVANASRHRGVFARIAKALGR